MNYKVLLRDTYSGTFYWVGTYGLKLCADIADSSLAQVLTEDEADDQIDWYTKFDMNLECKIKVED